MKRQVIPLLRCPACGSELKADVREESEDRVREGALRCIGCEAAYPVERGIAALLPQRVSSRGTAERFGYQWATVAAHRFERGRLYGKTEREEVEEFFDVTRLDREALSNLCILDAGCGLGRLTRNLGAFSETVVGLEVAETVREAESGPASFIQGDILAAPFAEGAFDVVWSQGVIHHTGATCKAFQTLSDLVRPGGLLYVWVYPKKRTRYMKARDAIRVGHRLPAPALLVLCYALAGAVWLWKLPKSLKHRLGKKTHRRDYSFRRFAFDFFDNLAPPYQSRHTEAEVREWFSGAGFEEPWLCGKIAFCGRKRPA